MTKKELEIHNKFLLKQMKLSSKGIIRLLYRGDSLSNLCEKLNVEHRGSDTDIKTILERLFMVGEKGKRYFKDSEGFTNTDTDDIVFEKIVDYFKDSIGNKKIMVKAFFDANEEFKKFFKTKRNKSKFIKALATLNDRDRLDVRNYYLILLHQLSAVNYRDKSHFVSTTTDYEIAKKFSGHKIDKSDQIILHCWQPNERKRRNVQNCGLPTYRISPYPIQKEITIFSGIFPHFISGIEIMKTSSFYPNPNIFNGKITTDTFLYGINIDQRNFDVIARLTNYNKTITSDGVDTWENSISR